MAFIFRPAEQAISVEKKSIAGLKSDRCFGECRSFDHAQRRRHRSDGFCCAAVANPVSDMPGQSAVTVMPSRLSSR